VEFASKIFKKVKRMAIVIAVGVIEYFLSFMAIGLNHISETLTAILTFAGIMSAFLIPLFLYITAKVKKHAAKNN